MKKALDLVVPQTHTVPQDKPQVADRLQDLAKSICRRDPRLQFVVETSFELTPVQRQIADELGVRVAHHVHDLVLYRLMIEDIHVCVVVLLEILKASNVIIEEEWKVLIDGIDEVYFEFLRPYVEQNADTRAVIARLVQETKCM